MAAPPPVAIPKWLGDSKDHISTTKEWRAFTAELYVAIQQQLHESHVSKFADLTDAERALFLERASKAIQNGQTYKDFYTKVSQSLDQHVNSEVARQLIEEFPLETKSDLVLDEVQEGAMALLRRWPDMKYKLRVCFNQPLPKPIRHLGWRLYLENKQIRKQYSDLLFSNPQVTVSKQEPQIAQKCDYLLKAETTFNDLKGSVGAFHAMKAVLSYYHRHKKTGAPLSDVDFMLCVPFIHVSSHKMPRHEYPPSKVVTLLVEEYISFMTSRPGYMVDSGTEEHEQMESFTTKVVKHVKEHCPETTATIAKAYSDDQEKIVTTDAGSQLAMVDGMTHLIRPVIHNFFSGYLSIEPLLYMWDQYIIGSDVAGYHDLLLPILTAVLLILLRDKLKDCSSPADLETTLKLESPKLKIHQFQQRIKLHYFDELSTMLQGDKTGLPILDPAQAKYPPWTHWNSDRVPPRLGPADRRGARQERDAEREEQVAHQRALEAQRRQEEENQRKDSYRKLIEQQTMQNDLKHRLTDTEETLQRVKQQFNEAELRSQRKLDMLQEEVERLRLARKPVPSVEPDRRSSTPSPQRTPTPTPNLPAMQQTTDIVLEILRKVADGFNKAACGEGDDRKGLDRQSLENVKLYKQDIRHAQREVFGRQLQPDEFQRLPESEKQQATDRMMDVVKERMGERRQQRVNSKKNA